MDNQPPLAVLQRLGYTGDERIALFPPVLLDDISTDLLLSCRPEAGNDLLAHYRMFEGGVGGDHPAGAGVWGVLWCAPGGGQHARGGGYTCGAGGSAPGGKAGAARCRSVLRALGDPLAGTQFHNSLYISCWLIGIGFSFLGWSV